MSGETGGVGQAILMAAVEQAGEGVLGIGPGGNITFVNRSFTASTGYSCDELVGQSWLWLTGAEPPSHCDDPWTTVQAGRVWRGELTFRRKDESWYHTQLRITPVREVDGSVSGYLAVDLELAARFRELVEQAPSGACLIGLSGRFLHVNQSLCLMIGKAPEELLNTTLRAVSHPDDRRIPDRVIAGLLVDPTGRAELESRFIGSSGTSVAARTRMFLKRDCDGEPTCVLAYIEDETESCQPKVPGDSEERFRIMADCCPTLLWVTDAQGGIRFVNRTCREFFGAEYEELADVRWQSVLHPEDAPAYMERLYRALENRGPFRAEARVRRADGQWRWIASQAGPRLSPTGEFLGHVGISPDITKRKQAEDALRDSEERYRHQFVDNSVVMLLIDPGDGRIVDANTVALNFYKYPRQQLLGMQISDISIGLETETATTAPARDRQSVQLQHRLSDGSVRDVEVSSSRIQFSGRTLLYSIVFDITSRKRAEQKLRLSEAMLRGITDSAQDAIVMMDPNGSISHWNRAAESILGYTKKEAIGQNLHQLLVPGRYMQAHRAALPEFLQTGSGDAIGKTLELEARRKDGAEIDVDLSLSAIRLNGEWHAVGILRDITGRKRAQAQLAATTDRLTLAARAGGVGIWDLDIANNRLEWDDQMFSLYGSTRDQFVGAYEAWLAALHPDDLQRGDEEIQLALTGIRDFNTEFRVVWADRSVHSIRALALVQRDAAGRPTRMIGTNWDITAQKLAADELRESNRQLEAATVRASQLAREAATANVAKSEFLANMSHEIRTPLNGVIGMTGLLLDTPLNDEQRRYAEIGRSSGEALLALINDILDFSKIEARKLELETVSFDLSSLLDDFASTQAVAAQVKGLELLCAAGPEVPAFVCGDPGRLRQILTNLVSNAVKFTSAGEVVVRASVAGRSASDVLLRFVVRDTGIGISREKFSKLFQTFSQVDASTTRRHGGTGLGLAISKRLVEMMGGEIGLTSEENVGSEFWFTVRLAVDTQSWRGPDRALAILENLRILVIDDSSSGREILSRRLTSWGMRVSEAEDGLEGLHILYRGIKERDPYCIAFVDGEMPEMNGEALSRVVQADPRLAQTRLVLLTSPGLRGFAHAIDSPGFSSRLSKPVRDAELAAALLQALDHSTGREPLPHAVTSSAAPLMQNRFAGRKARILLAEDNIVNQEVVIGILTKFELRTDAVANGTEAVKALESLPYDLVLMDVQMPEMDGLEATEYIRSPNSTVLDRNIPIIALTAHAMLSDRDRCLKAGMNDYLSKPVSAGALLDAIAKWLGPQDSATLRPGNLVPSIADAAATVFDRTGMMARLMGDETLAAKVVNSFLTDIPCQLQALKEQLQYGDVARSERSAHCIKGAAANVGGEQVRRVASELEKAAKARNLEGAKAYAANLEAEFDRLRAAMKPG